MTSRVGRACVLVPVIVCTFLMSVAAKKLLGDTGGGKERRDTVSSDVAPRSRSVKSSHTPLSFEPNEGQTDKRVKFLSRSNGYTVFFTDADAVFSLHGMKAENGKGSGNAVRSADFFTMHFVGGNLHPESFGAGVLPGRTNYLIGKDTANWKRNIPNYSEIKYRNVFPGVDVRYYGDDRRLEFDLDVSPGSFVNRIALTLEGVNDLHVTKDGGVRFTCGPNQLSFGKPRIYQVSTSGNVESISGSWVLNKKGQLGFQIGNYDHSRILVIDPVLKFGGFPFATYLGGSGIEQGWGIAVDSTGAVYVTGDTDSNDFPTTNGALQGTAPGTNGNAFVTKMNADGSLVYSTYLGGSTESQANGIAVNAAGNAFIVGTTTAHGSFPTNPPATGCDATNEFCNDVFVAELSAAGDSLVYGHYLAGNHGSAIALDSNGNAYITGSTLGVGQATSILQPNFGGGNTDAFVAKVDNTGTVIWWTFLGGSGSDTGSGIALDTQGNVYVAGNTESKDFPIFNALHLQRKYGGNEDAFVAEINNSGTAFVYSTFLGGRSAEQCFGLAVDTQGNAYVTGSTTSTDFPTTNPIQPSYGGTLDAFVTKIAPAGANFVYSTFFGGAAYDDAKAIAVDAQGNVYVVGETQSEAIPIGDTGPNTIGAIDPNLLNLATNSIQPQCADTSGCTSGDAYVFSLDASGTGFRYFTYLGGGGGHEFDYALALALDSSANCSQTSALPAPFVSPCVYVTGSTGSTSFPVSTDTALSGSSDAFVALVPSLAAPICSATLTHVGLTATVSLGCTKNFTGGKGLVNWGDNSTDTLSLAEVGSVVSSPQHTFAAAGNYSISASMTDNTSHTTFDTGFPLQPFGPITVTVSANGLNSVQYPNSLALSATVTNASDQSVSWSVNNVPGGNSTVGAISSSGAYTPPPITTPTVFNITATSNANHKTSSVPFPVTADPSPVTSVTVSPAGSTSVLINNTQQFSATVTGDPTNSVTWSVSGTGCQGNACGTVDASGLYTAPPVIPNPAIVSITATSTINPTVTGNNSKVTVTSNVSVVLSPKPNTAALSTPSTPQTVRFTAILTNAGSLGVTWTLTQGNTPCNPACGTLGSSTTPNQEIYTAPVTAPSSTSKITVTATSVADTSKSDFAQFNLGTNGVQLPNGASQDLSVSVPGQSSTKPSGIQMTGVPANSTVQFQLSCSDLPPGAICSFALPPNNITPVTYLTGGSPTALVTMVTTGPPSTTAGVGWPAAPLTTPLLRMFGLLAMALVCLVWVVNLSATGRWRSAYVSFIALLVFVGFLSSCGGFSPANVPPVAVQVTPQGSGSIRVVATPPANSPFQTVFIQIPYSIGSSNP